METVERDKYLQSGARYAEARKYLSGGVSSNFRQGMKPFPLFFKNAQGSKLYDVDGNHYIDYVLGMGPVILGHAHAAVNSAVAVSLTEGQLFAGQHEAELELAREICSIVPCAEMVRFSMSGSEGVQGALRLARAFTGRNRIAKFEGHYHGWFDNVFVSVHPSDCDMGSEDAPYTVRESLGSDPDASRSMCVLPWNNIDALRKLLESDNDIAAVIMEPIMANSSVILPGKEYLSQVRELCSRHGVLLIFDEVITGFRVALGGAQTLLGITPDLAVFAKAMGNGYPISCIAGRADIVELFSTQPVVHGGTFNSNVISCAAALATIRYLREHESTVYPQLRRMGGLLMDGIRELNKEFDCGLLVQGLPMMFHTAFTQQKEIVDYRCHQRCAFDQHSQFMNGLQENGVRVTGRGTWFLSAAHTERDIDTTLQGARQVLAGLQLPATPTGPA